MFDELRYNDKMSKTYEVFQSELSSLRTGRANAGMLDIVKVDVYGQKMPINQLASVTTPEPRMINIQVWDLNNVSLIDSSIRNITREANDDLKKLLKDKHISEDELKKNEKIIQEYTDNQIKVIDEKVEIKEKEIMTI